MRRFVSEGTMETIHSYRIKAASTKVRSGVVAVEGIEPSLSFSAPPEFRGQAGHWTPEHFLVTAVATCYVSTFSGIAEVSRFEFLSLDLEAEGILEKEGSGWRFSTVTLCPRLKIAREEDRERALRLLEKAEKGCLIARSLNCSIAVTPEIKVEEELLQREKVGSSAASVA
jgi:peroxiredoxin-like protein